MGLFCCDISSMVNGCARWRTRRFPGDALALIGRLEVVMELFGDLQETQERAVV